MHYFKAISLLGPLLYGRSAARWSGFGNPADLDGYPEVFLDKPPDPPAYMVDNTRNENGRAPINGEYNGPVWQYSGSLENYMRRLRSGEITLTTESNTTTRLPNQTSPSVGGLSCPRAKDYWLPTLAPLGKQPIAGQGYKFYRDVTKYGADPTGKRDAVEAINAAISDAQRCGEECGNTFAQGAIVYFPPGTYKICTPIVQLYYTQFIGDPCNRPVIKGCDSFTGIALMDTDPYVPNKAQPDGSGVNWYINQNQFFRQIRNFVFDMTDMPWKTDDHGQPLSPTGIHWQVSQATSLQNLLFKMPVAEAGKNVTHVGIFTENGSGGFVSDLEFEGGSIGWRVGSQQYTARGLRFFNCQTSIQMIWDWGFTWQQVEIYGGSIGFNISGTGGLKKQGTGSISIIDSTVKNVPIGILTHNLPGRAPNIVIDNTLFENVGKAVQAVDGPTLLAGALAGMSFRGQASVDVWATGRRYNGSAGRFQTGSVTGQSKRPPSLLKDGRIFVRSRPQYEDLDASSFLVATDRGISNNGDGDNTAQINSFLRDAAAAKKIAYFPAGIYSVHDTVTIPKDSRIQGASWSQIQGTGKNFEDMKNPRVVVKVGEPGDSGVMEIVEMIFSVKGPTAGAIVVEWNIHESSQGSVGMWDSHIRVGGAKGSDLDVANCPKLAFNSACICASLLLHVTPKASGYFENVWAWVADHDNDMSLYWEPDATASQISLYGGRGMLIESQGPCWFYGTASEHTVLYQYQLYKAKDIYMGHIQTESPYFQPKPAAPAPFERSNALSRFVSDPIFQDCKTDSCKEAWGLRIVDSENVIIHGAGLYSWFTNYDQPGCLPTESCQERIMEITGSKSVTIYNIFTKGVVEVGTGVGGSIKQSDSIQQGYTTEISVWIPTEGDNIVYIGPEVYTAHSAACTPPCVMVIAPSPLGSNTTISIPPYTTSLEVGSASLVDGKTTFVVTTKTVTITVSAVTTDKIPVSNVNVTAGQTGGWGFRPEPSVSIPPQTIPVEGADGSTTTRVVTLPPWPAVVDGPPDQVGSNSTTGAPVGSSTGGGSVPLRPPPDAPFTRPPIIIPCSLTTPWVEEHSARITLRDCSGVTTLGWDCPPITTVGIECPTDTSFRLGCTMWSGTGTPLPVYTTWPPGALVWTKDPVDEPQDDGKTPCKLWFFWLCINWGDDVHIGGWQWNFPTGILPPGPPPNIRLPPGVTISGSIPGPWPPVTIGPSGKPTYPTSQPKNCKTKTADICATTSSFDISTSGRSTTTTATRTRSTCTTIMGCEVEDDDRTKSTTSTSSCTRTVHLGRRDTAAHPTGSSTIQRRAGECTAEDSIIYPLDPKDVTSIVNYLQSKKYQDDQGVEKDYMSKTKQVQSTRAGFTAFFFVADLPSDILSEMDRMKSSLKIEDCYGIFTHGTEIFADDPAFSGEPEGSTNNLNGMARVEMDKIEAENGGNGTQTLHRRADFRTTEWEMPQVFTPPGGNPKVAPNRGRYSAHESLGKGQIIYVLEDGIYEDPPNAEFDLSIEVDGQTVKRDAIRKLPAMDFGPEHLGEADFEHGTKVLSKIWGKQLGIAKRAQIVLVENYSLPPAVKANWIQERHLEALVRVIDDVYEHSPENIGKVIINMSFAWLNNAAGVKKWKAAHHHMFYKALSLLEELGAVLVCAAHNNYGDPEIRNRLDGWPHRFGNPSETTQLSSLIVVGGTNKNTEIGSGSPYASWLAMAPGWAVAVAGKVAEEGRPDRIVGDDGCSFATPLLVGLIAYWRGLPDVRPQWQEELKIPYAVKKLVGFMHRPLAFQDYGGVRIVGDRKARVPFVWSGRVKGGDCLVDPNLEGCPPFKDHIYLLPPNGASTGGEAGGSITFSPGAPSPTCRAEQACGTLCTGYYCAASSPAGPPPDYHDPADPSYGGTPKPPETPKPSQPTSQPPPPSQTPTNRYDCEGNTACNILVNVKHCDEAVNRISGRGDPNHKYGTADGMFSGNCWANANGDFGCMVYVRGSNQWDNDSPCIFTADEIWNAYQDIRNRDKGNCKVCGTKHIGNGCLISIDWISSCDNRDTGLDWAMHPNVTMRL